MATDFLCHQPPVRARGDEQVASSCSILTPEHSPPRAVVGGGGEETQVPGPFPHNDSSTL